jgi:hypothetical protein
LPLQTPKEKNGRRPLLQAGTDAGCDHFLEFARSANSERRKSAWMTGTDAGCNQVLEFCEEKPQAQK